MANVSKIRLCGVLLLVGCIGGLLWIFLFTSPTKSVYEGEPRQWQEASKIVLPQSKTVFDPRWIFLSPCEMAALPMTDGFDYPLGTASGQMMYDAQPMSVDNEKRGGKHQGHDFNGLGGEDTEMGDPVYAVARGKVVYSGIPSPGWGKVLVLAHRLPTGEVYQSLYAHLKSIDVAYGDTLGRGKKLGEVGNAEGMYTAHLHIEIIPSISMEVGLPGYYKNMTNRCSFLKWCKKAENGHVFKPSEDVFTGLQELYLERNRPTLQPISTP